MERILRIVLALAADGAPVMPTLSANLRRSDADLHRLIDAGVPVLPVKSPSLEPPRLARRWGEETDLAFLRFALENGRAGSRAGGGRCASMSRTGPIGSGTGFGAWLLPEGGERQVEPIRGASFPRRP